ncbi:hypothetical protein Aduo_019702 [Ancylostoma duodenale]
MTVSAIDVCLTAAAAEKVAEAYSLRGRDTIQRGPVGREFDAAMEDLEIARVMFYQGIDLLDTIPEKFAVKCKARLLTNFVSVCLIEFHALFGRTQDLTHPQFMVDEVTIQYAKIIDKLETESSASPFEEAVYIKCLIAFGSAYMLFAERYIDHPHRSSKEKAMAYLKNALRANKALMLRNIDADQKSSVSVDILAIFDSIIVLKKSALEQLERRGASREEMRSFARESSFYILNLFDHMLTMVSDPKLPVKQRNFTFEICVLHKHLMDLPYVRDNVKIYGCSQVLMWLKQMVPVILIADGAKATSRLLGVRNLVREVLSGMMKKMPQCPFVKKSVECMKKVELVDDAEKSSKLILDSIDEVLASFPAIDIAAELEGVSW